MKRVGFIFIAIAVFSCQDQKEKDLTGQESSVPIPGTTALSDGDCVPINYTMYDYAQFGDSLFLIRLTSVEEYPVERSAMEITCSNFDVSGREECFSFYPAVAVRGEVIASVGREGMLESGDLKFVFDAVGFKNMYNSQLVSRGNGPVEWNRENRLQPGQIIGFIGRNVDGVSTYKVVLGTEFQVIGGEVVWHSFDGCTGSTAEWLEIRDFNRLMESVQDSFETEEYVFGNDETEEYKNIIRSVCDIRGDVCDGRNFGQAEPQSP